jgi:exodeoxyribonuclease V beta subunit
LVVEAGIPVSRILVVTYTNAATKELRDRIRARLSAYSRRLPARSRRRAR